MGRKRKGILWTGWINLDKPAGMTSMQAVAAVRRILHAAKAGHAGTLDPSATGVLPIALGDATKTVSFVQDARKGYLFAVKWGAQTNTDDAEGETIETSDARPTRAQIEALLPDFTGAIEQVPPQFSAIKINGERAYALARKGEEVEIKSREVQIDDLVIVDTPSDDMTVFEVTCGKGTYVRSLARDMGQKLGCLGHIIELRRSFVGQFDEEDAISLDALEELAYDADLSSVMTSLVDALADISAVTVTDDEAQKLRQGMRLSFFARHDVDRLPAPQENGKPVKQALAILDTGDDTPEAVALVKIHKAQIRPDKVFASPLTGSLADYGIGLDHNDADAETDAA